MVRIPHQAQPCCTSPSPISPSDCGGLQQQILAWYAYPTKLSYYTTQCQVTGTAHGVPGQPIVFTSTVTFYM